MEQSVNCQSNNIMHYIMLQSAPTKATFKRVTTYQQCLSYHETKFFHYQQVDSVNNKLAVFIMKHNLPNHRYDMLKVNTKFVCSPCVC